MKHTLHITLIIAAIFFISQVVGLVTVNQYLSVDIIDGKARVDYPETLLGKPPEVEEKTFSFIYIMLTILVGTAFIFVLIHFKLGKLWKYWFLFAVVMTLAISFGVYINPFIAFVLALILGLIKVFKPNIFVHNFTEVFIYTGITIAILPLINLFSAFMLLLLISVYDAIAVWKSKHMIKLAEFQTESKVFAGLLIPYKDKREGEIKVAKVKTAKVAQAKKVANLVPVAKSKDSETKTKIKGKAKNAILGGGDIAFPLIFSAVVMQHLIEFEGYSKLAALNSTFIIAITTTIALAALLFFSKENRFYPAMPFISAGCILGYVIVLLL
ncbi:MAG: presenilin family intramembrane aspartyl protease [Nanoarchaeota archaeon]|nr:presenilin family intramembrane aspartyl protease [Nanoarchaeota archaeon]